MEHFHVNPDTLQPIVEGAYNFGGKSYDVNASGVTPKEAPGQPQAAGGATPKYSPEQMSGKAPIGAAADGKPVFLRDGKYVHEDGTPVQ